MNSQEETYFQSSKTIIQLNKTHTTRANEGSSNTCFCCFTSIIFINVNKTINKHSYQNYTYSSNAAMGWLWIEEHCKNQQKHSMILFYVYPLAIWNLQWRVFVYFSFICKLCLQSPDICKIYSKLMHFFSFEEWFVKYLPEKHWNELSFLNLKCLISY